MAFSFRWLRHNPGGGYAVVQNDATLLDMSTYKAGTWGSDSSAFKGVVSLRFNGGDVSGIKVWCDPSRADLLTSAGGIVPRQDLVERGYEIKGMLIDPYRIAYSRESQAGESNIFSAGAEAQDQQQITHHSLDNYDGSYNFDGTQVVFVSERGGKQQVFRSNIDGSGAVALTEPTHNAAYPSWCRTTDTGAASFNKIVYASDEHSGWQLYVMNADGTGKTRLTNRDILDYEGDDYSPCWNHDGTRICFVSTRLGAPQVYRILSNGTGTAQVSSGGFPDIDPAYGPPTAPSKIAFSSKRTGSYDVFLCDDDGSNLQRVTQTGRDCTSPAWYPSGSKVAFVSSENARKAVFSINTNGTSIARVSFSASDDDNPEVSPSGDRMVHDTLRVGERTVLEVGATGINLDRLTENGVESFDPCFDRTGELFAFATDRGSGDVNIYQCGASLDLSEATAVTANSGVSWQPTWSYDGSQLAFSTNRDGNFQVYRIEADGTGQLRLVNNAFECTHPSWSPVSSGSKIAYQSTEAGGYQIFTMDPDGTDQEQLTSVGDNIWPCYSRDGSRIAFASNRGGGEFLLYTMASDGSSQAQVGNHVVSSPPEWSADGTRIIFNKERFELYSVLASDGSSAQRITQNALQEDNVAADPNGTRLVFDAADPDGKRKLFVVDPEGGNERNVDTLDARYSGSWSHDGQRVVFSRLDAFDREIAYSAEWDGGDVGELTFGSAIYDRAPIYCPANERVYFERLPIPGSAYQICYWSAGGSVTVQHTTTFGTESLQDVSADGARVLLAAGGKLYELNGTTMTELVDNSGASIPAEYAAYSPTRKQVALIMPGGSGSYPAHSQVFVYTLTSKKLTKLTDTPTAKRGISWNPTSGLLLLSEEIADGVFRLHTMTTAGANKSRLVTDGTDDLPSTAEILGRWSSDGSSVVYLRKTSVGLGIHVTEGPGVGQRLSSSVSVSETACSYDSSNERAYFAGAHGPFVDGLYRAMDDAGAERLTNFGAYDRFASYNPDSTRIATQTRFNDSPSVADKIYIANVATYWSKARLTTLATTKAESHPDWSSTDKIAFDCAGGIYTANPDGTSVTAIVAEGSGASMPRWSPDGSRIVFIKNGEVWTMSSTGSDSYRICAAVSPSGDRSPSYTPNGEEIVFEAPSNSGDGLIYRVTALPDSTPRQTGLKGTYPKCDYVIGRVLYSKYRASGHVLAWRSLNGDDETVLTELSSDDVEPRYKPDGSQIAFSSNRTGSYKIYTMSNAGLSPTLVTNFAGNHRHPSYNPSGTTIVFSSDATGAQDIYTVPSGGGAGTRLTTSLGEDYRPCFNHDGTKIAFVSTRNGKASIHTMDSNGANQVAIATQGNCDWPAISPDGTLVTFVSDRSGEWKLYYCPVEGGEAVMVDTGEHQVYASAWKSDGSEIAYIGGVAGARHIYRRATPLNAPADILPVREDGECADLWWGQGDTKIVFSSNIDGQFEIYKITSNGADEERVADTDYADAYEAAWNYNGTEIAYVTRALGAEHIVKVSAVSGAYTVLTTGTSRNSSPSWEPNSTSRIVFQSNRSTTTNLGSHFNVWRMSPNGLAVTQLTFGDFNSVEPQWSPNGSAIVFSSDESGEYKLYTMAPDGTSVAQLTTSAGNHRQPTYHPDGLSVLFQSDETGEWQLYSVVVSSGAVTRLTQNTANCTEPVWSSDGEYAYYTRDDGEQTRSVWRVSADGLTDEQWFAADNLDVHAPASTIDDAFGGAFAQDPSTWSDLPVSKDAALDMGYALADKQRIAHSRRLALAIKVPAGEADQSVAGLRLLASFVPR